jgi:hypothetical protein
VKDSDDDDFKCLVRLIYLLVFSLSVVIKSSTPALMPDLIMLLLFSSMTKQILFFRSTISLQLTLNIAKTSGTFKSVLMFLIDCNFNNFNS